MGECLHNLTDMSCFKYPQSEWCKYCCEIQDVFEILKEESKICELEMFQNPKN